jgi:hypothetical protein
MCTLRSISRAVCLTALLSVALLAQSDRGTVTGTIADPANAVVPRAKVTVKNSETGTVATTLTTPTGNYTVVSLPTGVYELTVEAPGFKKTTQTGGFGFINLLAAETPSPAAANWSPLPVLTEGDDQGRRNAPLPDLIMCIAWI